jgi:hypothetical protein
MRIGPSGHSASKLHQRGKLKEGISGQGVMNFIRKDIQLTPKDLRVALDNPLIESGKSIRGSHVYASPTCYRLLDAESIAKMGYSPSGSRGGWKMPDERPTMEEGAGLIH